MTRKDFIKELGQYISLDNVKVRFNKVSKFQANRYKPEFVGWEAWLYNGKSSTGFVVTKEDWENKEYLKTYLEAFNH